ncbi:MAG TPA: carboxylesterase family protein [Flavobacteriales bacterium]
MRNLLFLPLLASFSAPAQDCLNISYTQPLFGFTVQQGIVYDTVPRFDGGTDTLKLDLYRPTGDGQTERPLVVMVHGGGFTGGDRSDMAELCEQFASCGWAAATISYRLGFHGQALLGNPFAYDEAEVVRAAYRGLLDTRSAIHFLQSRSAIDGTIADKVMLLGFSAGGINVLHAAYARNEALRPTASFALGDVTLPSGTYARPDLGSLNSTGASGDEVLGVASFFGGIIDTNMIASANDPALFMYHQTGDPVVGCGYQRGLWGLPFGVSDNYPYLFGSCVIDQRAQHLGYTPERYRFIPYEGNEHTVHDIPGLMAQTLLFMREQICGNLVGVDEEESEAPLRIWPVPANGTFQVDLPATVQLGGELQLLDASGRIVLRERINGHPQTVRLPSVTNGSYVARYTAPDGQVHQRRLVVAR